MGKKRGQITIFMILGVMLLFIFFFLLQFTSSLQKRQLTAAQEDILTNALHKETLRIYVEDCLEDELPEGLTLLGSQGAIWRDQGGSRAFLPGVNGLSLGGEKISYAISLTAEENKYPCSSGDPTEGPAFCQFTLPNQDIKFNRNVFFGRKEFSIPRLERDLSGFLKKQLEECVKQKIFGDNPAQVESSSEGAELNVDIQSSSIVVGVHYPLRFSAGERELFTLSEFDFVYPTKIGKFFDALTKQIDKDIMYGDFPYKEAFDTGTFYVLSTTQHDGCPAGENGLYSCPKEFDQRPFQQFNTELSMFNNDNGDDVSEYSLTLGDARLDQYTFKIARQNRPPALSYISQCPVEGQYDYLYIPGTDLNLEKLVANAVDADEDDPVTYTFKHEGEVIIGPLSENVLDNFLIRVTASDGNKEDWQEVKVRTDQKVEPRVIISNMVTGDEGHVSLEDPGCIVAERPEGVPGDAQVSSFQFSLNDQPLQLEFGEEYGLAVMENEQSVIKERCNLNEFDIATINTSLQQYIPPPQQGVLQQQLAVEGHVSYSDDPHCQYDSNQPVQFVVQQCQSVADSGAPSLPYVEGMTIHQYELNDDGNYEYKGDINSFTVPRPCCNGNSIEDVGTVCFDSAPSGNGCFENEYYLQHIVAKCDGIRGNICGGGGKEVTPRTDPQGNQLCGSAGKIECNAEIPEECAERPAWGVGNEGWCSGTSGCAAFCTEEVVDKSAVSANPARITAGSEEQPLTVTSGLSPDGAQFQCACTAQYRGYSCDADFDGKFDGVCEEDRFLGILFGYSCHEEGV